MGKDIEGRKVVVVGESSDSMCLASDAQDADVIVHAASCKVRTANIAGPLQYSHPPPMNLGCCKIDLAWLKVHCRAFLSGHIMFARLIAVWQPFGL